jgi:hypothetical protein
VGGPTIDRDGNRWNTVEYPDGTRRLVKE